MNGTENKTTFKHRPSQKEILNTVRFECTAVVNILQCNVTDMKQNI